MGDISNASVKSQLQESIGSGNSGMDKNTCDDEHLLTVLSESKCFGGVQQIVQHQSKETACLMKFSIFIPELKTPDEKFHAVFLLAGIMCNEQNFYLRTGFQRFANEQRLIVVAPDTSPRDCNIPGERDSIFIGRSAGWYCDATQEPWSSNYRMYSYISQELPRIIKKNFPTTGKIGLCGHSMGGHGTLVIGLRNPETFHTLSLLAPSCNAFSWGKEIIFDIFLGNDEELQSQYNPVKVIPSYNGPFREILVDVGLEDEYLTHLSPATLEECVKQNPNGEACLKINLNMHEGYDHSYYFVASFIENHLKHHAKLLNAKCIPDIK